MDLEGMHIFARVAEAKSFSEAARRLRISKSVVSKHVDRLEKSIGVRLLNRTTRSVSLTEVGQQFYQRCADIVSAVEDAERIAMHLQSDARGTLKVATPVSFGTFNIASELPLLRERHPELAVDLTLTSRVVSLIDEGYDMAVLIDQAPSPGVVARTIAPIERSICASPQYLARHGTPDSLEALKRHECVVFTGPGSGRKWHLRGPQGELWTSVHGAMCMNNLNAIRTAVLAHGGIGLLPHYLVGADLREGRLVALLPEFPPVSANMCAVYPAQRHLSPKVRVFVEFLIERFGNASGAWRRDRNVAELAPSALAA